MDSVSAVVFDLDGTLLDSQGGIVKAFQRTFEELGLAPAPDDEEIVAQIGLAFDAMLQGMGRPLPPDELARFVATYRRHYWEIAPRMSPPFEGVPELLAELARMKERLPGLAVGVATNKRSPMAQHILDHLRLSRYLDVVQGLEDGLEPKPAPDLLLRALERVGARPGQALFVGDTEGDLRAARAAGTRSCLAAYGYGASAVPPDLVPDLRIGRPQDLLRWLQAHLAA
ncbi:HAD family hydrolase [Limnochorda pilosa]|uniref:Phosphoglycolate phosphatase n=1 Tax=Limnochorda pilosa TaxID=1555112 RepID=A0A0K2SL51_LIMPI|nr:HAD family hydrolase [Limnochorda pilosa]BAS27843.1 hypothetical protein LIP_2002 [Limnochorda pilosa]